MRAKKDCVLNTHRATVIQKTINSRLKNSYLTEENYISI